MCTAQRPVKGLLPTFQLSDTKHSLALLQVINFNLLCEESLLRYQQTYGLGMTPGSSKEELVWAVQHHFKYQEVRQFAHSSSSSWGRATTATRHVGQALASRLASFRADVALCADPPCVPANFPLLLHCLLCSGCR